ncbi:MAG: hypothetical protein CMH04_00270 [Marinovum sp.]|jgi:hypothetical protein|nr:hypothetical protein [Marinovum sp.]
MNEINLAQFILKLVKDKKAQVSELLVNNGVKDMEHYRQLMGNLDGLEYVEQELKSLLEKQEQFDD